MRRSDVDSCMSIRRLEKRRSKNPVWDRLAVVLMTLVVAGGLDIVLRSLAPGAGNELGGLDGLYSYDGIDRLCKLLLIIACFWWISESPRRTSDADLSGLKMIQAIEGELRVRERGKLIEKVVAKGVDLGGADLRAANLEGLDLKRAEFRRSNLRAADLRRTDLRSADLSAARMESALLLDSNLRKAQLRNAYLASVNLTGANLRGVDLTGAYVGGANFTGVTNLTLQQFSGVRWIQGDPPVGLGKKLASFVRERFVRTHDGWVRCVGP